MNDPSFRRGAALAAIASLPLAFGNLIAALVAWSRSGRFDNHRFPLR